MYYIMDDFSYPRFINIALDKKSVVETEEADPSRYEFEISQFKSVIYIRKIDNRLIKIIMSDKDVSNEVELQQTAAKYNLAPKIILSSPRQIPDTTLFGSPYYFIEMEYLNPQFWVQIGAVGEDVDEYNDVLCQFIRELVEQTNIYNIEDPQVHFYFNVYTSEIKMIDFDRSKQCLDEDKEYFIKAMYEKIPGLKCNKLIRSTGDTFSYYVHPINRLKKYRKKTKYNKSAFTRSKSRKSTPSKSPRSKSRKSTPSKSPRSKSRKSQRSKSPRK